MACDEWTRNGVRVAQVRIGCEMSEFVRRLTHSLTHSWVVNLDSVDVDCENAL